MLRTGISSMDLHDEPHTFMIDPEQISYEEIEGVVSNKDVPGMLCLTVRSCLLGVLLAISRAIGDSYFSYRTETFMFDAIYVVLISYLLGKFLSWVLPRCTWKIGERWRFSMNPGPFTIKEHALIIIMATSCYPSQTIQLLDFRRVYFPQSKMPHAAVSIIYLVSMDLLGFGMAGIFRRVVIWPSKMVWPTVLPLVALLRTLHDKNVDGPTSPPISRLKFLIVTSLGQFIYSWLPSFIMPVLTSFSPLCLINRESRLLAQLTGANGFGFGAFQFDWPSITNYLATPIIVPRWAQVNMCIGFLVIIWMCGPIVYYTNLWESNKLPVRSTDYLTANNSQYNLSAVSDREYRLNRTAYDLYNAEMGGVRVSAMHIIELCSTFAFLPALFVHTLLYHGKWILRQARTSFANRNNDIHCKLMAKYDETPEWWFILLFVVNLVVITIVSHMNEILWWYEVLLAVLIACVCILPFTIFLAETAQAQDTGSVFVYFLLAAVLRPSDPAGYITFYGQIVFPQYQALRVLSFLKMSHFMKIPPRAVFGMVLVSVILSSIATYFTSDAVMNSIPNVCTPANQQWICPDLYVLYIKSIFLTIIHPTLLFGRAEGLYYPTLWFMLIGSLLPIPFWLLSHRYPNNKYLARIHTPLVVLVGIYWYAISAASIFSWLLLGVLCAFLVHRWWYQHYALLFSASMNVGAYLAVLLIYFIFTYRQITFPAWWGTREMCPLANPYETMHIYV